MAERIATLPEDARLCAAAIMQPLQQAHLKNAFCCYGTYQRVLVGIGRESSFEAKNPTAFDALWTSISEYLEANASDHVFGFIGFDPANQMGRKIGNPREKIDLFVPKIVIECLADAWTVVKGEVDIETPEIEAIINSWPQPNGAKVVAVTARERSEFVSQYAASAAHFIEAIRTGTLERATLARRFNAAGEFDLLRTFTADHNQHDTARSFYFSNTHTAFAGQCPELLAEGNLGAFATHKLSGTYAKTAGVSIAELSARFQGDERIVAEHQSAIAAIEKSLRTIGDVHSTRFQLMELPALLHGWSKFITRPHQGMSIARCLRSIFPFGVNPVGQGFKLLAEHECFNRGPYYGLVGCVCPAGEFSFTQVLRSAFIDKDSSYLVAGAAITARSTVELEAAETYNKLSSIRVYKRGTEAEKRQIPC